MTMWKLLQHHRMPCMESMHRGGKQQKVQRGFPAFAAAIVGRTMLLRECLCGQSAAVCTEALRIVMRFVGPGGKFNDFGFIHFINLFRVEKLQSIFEIDLAAHENIEQIGIDVAVAIEFGQDA
jgi:hypothetical protein